mmetsp:Transcript_24849/g.17562  ORF Transcript_24849/g.17562 Transcript_24849/m.17562 type:complete len:135 (-) Transcript_24849:478-882(-)|eukprot:CAMPEP_0116879658 /NCGR_PEP_ID=MMETSP0463-20121206/11476_1 /TAXON_ID=181622 /ORGANISM="Strombidinopsis sp, Strain SopsisLIS2011" /LENGTH=134 /DNA_ID=CAMNT_0004529235 /DNA_START=20 /DNA_END=424 /DNA_ORIENTATION=+
MQIDTVTNQKSNKDHLDLMVDSDSEDEREREEEEKAKFENKLVFLQQPPEAVSSIVLCEGENAKALVKIAFADRLSEFGYAEVSSKSDEEKKAKRTLTFATVQTPTTNTNLLLIFTEKDLRSKHMNDLVDQIFG